MPDNWIVPGISNVRKWTAIRWLFIGILGRQESAAVAAVRGAAVGTLLELLVSRDCMEHVLLWVGKGMCFSYTFPHTCKHKTTRASFTAYHVFFISPIKY